jgi:hypothetical protein
MKKITKDAWQWDGRDPFDRCAIIEIMKLSRKTDMRKIIDYDIIEVNCSVDVIKLVDDFMDDGWEPLGGVSSFVRGDQVFFVQAIVKYDALEKVQKLAKQTASHIEDICGLQKLELKGFKFKLGSKVVFKDTTLEGNRIFEVTTVWREMGKNNYDLVKLTESETYRLADIRTRVEESLLKEYEPDVLGILKKGDRVLVEARVDKIEDAGGILGLQFRDAEGNDGVHSYKYLHKSNIVKKL